MKRLLVSYSAVALTVATALPGVASAQAAWTPGAEIVGQPIQVTTNGTTNTVTLDQGGVARITTPNGNVVPGTWQTANGQLCLSASGAQECWPYNAPFQPGQPQTLTSSCNATSSWLAQSTNQPNQQMRGERGQ
jgi:hypothetical protein